MCNPGVRRGCKSPLATCGTLTPTLSQREREHGASGRGCAGILAAGFAEVDLWQFGCGSLFGRRVSLIATRNVALATGIGMMSLGTKCAC
jgi:hypothetical protein